MKSEKLIVALLDLAEFLQQHQRFDYAEKYFETAQALRENPSQIDLDKFLNSPYISGGMGTINDVILCRENGNPVSDAEQSSVNEKLRLLVEAVRFELKHGANRIE